MELLGVHAASDPAQLPVVISRPRSGSVLSGYAPVLNRYAPHPNAAQLAREYIFSDAGQLNLAGGNARPIRIDQLDLPMAVRRRLVDSAQYQNLLNDFNFDMTIAVFPQSLSPGNEQREFWGSEAAGRSGSRNLLGIKNPAIDKIIETLIFAKTRAELVASCRALDRALIWNHYVVPMWYISYERTARWDRYGRPAKLPDYSTGFPTIWWWDADKASKATRS